MFRVIVATFDPRTWPGLVQQVRVSSGADPAMLPLAVMVMLVIGAGLVATIPFAHLVFFIALAPLQLLTLLGATFAMLDSLRHVLFHGFRGLADSKTWFEIARASLILGVCIAVITGNCLYWWFSIFDFTWMPVVAFFGIFLIASLEGILIARKKDRKPSGDAYDFVDFFLLQFLAAIAVAIPWILLGRFVNPLLIIATTVLMALSLLVVLKSIEWLRVFSKNAG